MLRSLRRARGLEWLVIELHRAAHDLERLAVVAFEFDQHVVGERLLVGGEVLQALDRRPLTLHRLQMLPPVREWLGSDRLDDQIAGSAGVLDQLVDIGEARIVAGLRNRSEEHTSELQSLMRISYAVFCLKKKKKTSN